MVANLNKHLSVSLTAFFLTLDSMIKSDDNDYGHIYSPTTKKNKTGVVIISNEKQAKRWKKAMNIMMRPLIMDNDESYDIIIYGCNYYCYIYVYGSG